MLAFRLIYAIGLCGTLLLSANSISEHGKYVEYCGIASRELKEFANFKRNPIYRCILEHTTFQQGEEYLKVIEQSFPFLFQYMEKFKSNDAIGNPVVYHYPKIGPISPTTLQYIKIAGDLRSKFGDLSKFHIIENGGGYGGQCKIIDDLGGFSSYTIIDLPNPLALTEKYLAAQQVSNVFFLNPDQLPVNPQYDLLISNYAFSEIDRSEQVEYLAKLIKKVSRGYMIINFIHKFFNIDALSLGDIVSILKQDNINLSIESEIPPTGEGNVILSWKP